jgi:hypothetical protein
VLGFALVEVFYIVGSTLAAWALLVSALGVLRKDFPTSATGERLVGAISAVLVLGAISAAIIGALNEEEHEEDEGHSEAALVLPD